MISDKQMDIEITPDKPFPKFYLVFDVTDEVEAYDLDRVKSWYQVWWDENMPIEKSLQTLTINIASAEDFDDDNLSAEHDTE